jgi:thioredoxin 1
MNNITKITIVLALMAAIGGILAMKQRDRIHSEGPGNISPPVTAAISTEDSSATSIDLPTLIDLGADKCQACKMMKPVLDDLKVQYQDQFHVIFYDVWQQPDYARQYNIEMIPTQIFLDQNDKELFRHVGYISKEDILAKWRELGYSF